jgi:hypothetical protein
LEPIRGNFDAAGADDKLLDRDWTAAPEAGDVEDEVRDHQRGRFTSFSVALLQHGVRRIGL